MSGTSLGFRSRALGLVAPHAFAASDPFVQPGRLNLRGLYVTLADTRSPDEEAAETMAAARRGGWFVRVRGWFAGCCGRS